MIRGPKTMLREAGIAPGVRSVDRVDGPAAISRPSIRDTTLPSRPVRSDSRRADTRTRGRRVAPSARAWSAVTRYGSETVVLSPTAEITKVPDAVSLA